MKRKASTFDEPPSTMDWPSFDCSSNASTASPESVKATTDHHQTQTHIPINAVPYFSIRTRKRYRNGRPDDEIVHQNTLAKLFSAQRQMHTQDQQTLASGWSIPTHTAEVQHARHEPLVQASWRVPIITLSQPEPNQRSIDSFFGGAARKAVNVSHASAPPASFQFSTMAGATSVVGRCDDCSSVLEAVGADSFMSDVDDVGMDDVRHDEWACAACSRRICDMCAVRGDHRICLECAVPGGG